MLIAQYKRNAIFGKVFRKSNSVYTYWVYMDEGSAYTEYTASLKTTKIFLSQDAHLEEKNQSVQNTIFCPY
jgi:hypothetical protein